MLILRKGRATVDSTGWT